MTTERRIAACARAHETAENQNMTSVNRRDIEWEDDTIHRVRHPHDRSRTRTDV